MNREINDYIIELYKNGTRASSISKIINRAVPLEEIKNIIDDYKKGEYLYLEVNGVSHNNILNLYKQKKSVEEIMIIYPELNFGQIKLVIEGYYNMQAIKKPYKIKFPKLLIKEELKNNSIDEVCKKYGYSKETIKREMDIPLTKEEMFERKMKIIEKDVNSLSEKKFNSKYKDIKLTKNNAKRLVLEYKISNR